MSWQSSEPASDRFFSAIAYLLPISQVYTFGLFVFQQFPVIEQLYRPLAPLMAVDRDNIGGWVIFFALYLGVVNNPRVPRFIRFNVLQTILIGVLLSLGGLILSYLLLPLIGTGPVTQVLMNTVFFGTWLASIYGLVMSALGRYTEIPIISEAANMQVGRY
jgi:uncharacterized membrane protein